MGTTFDSSIAKLNAEIERMAPNMKAMDKFEFSLQLHIEALSNASISDLRTCNRS